MPKKSARSFLRFCCCRFSLVPFLLPSVFFAGGIPNRYLGSSSSPFISISFHVSFRTDGGKKTGKIKEWLMFSSFVHTSSHQLLGSPLSMNFVLFSNLRFFDFLISYQRIKMSRRFPLQISYDYAVSLFALSTRCILAKTTSFTVTVT